MACSRRIQACGGGGACTGAAVGGRSLSDVVPVGGQRRVGARPSRAFLSTLLFLYFCLTAIQHLVFPASPWPPAGRRTWCMTVTGMTSPQERQREAFTEPDLHAGLGFRSKLVAGADVWCRHCRRDLVAIATLSETAFLPDGRMCYIVSHLSVRLCFHCPKSGSF